MPRNIAYYIDTTMATSNEKLSLWTLPFPTSPILKDPKSHLEHQDEQWANIKAIIADITVPHRSPSSPTGSTTSSSDESTAIADNDEDEQHALLLPKAADPAPSSPAAHSSTPVYGTFTPSESATPVPLQPSTLLTSAALTPIYLLLLLLPLLPFWIFAAFLTYTAATTATSPSPALLIALGVLVPFNAVGTAAIVRFALGERARFAAGADVESGAVSSRRSSGSGEKKGGQRMWRPSMRFVLQGSQRG